MSLINKMLQDLDARGVPGGADPQLVKPVLRAEPKLVPRVALAVGLVAVVAVAGWFIWRAGHKAPVPIVQATMPLAPVPAGMVRVTPPQPVAVPVTAPAPVAEPVAVAPARPVKPVAIVRPAPRAEPVEAGAVTRSTVRGSEAEYRRALGELQDGRIHDAIATLEHTLIVDPRHEAARQTLVGLLIEAQRPDDAVRQLQLGLGLDPRQPAMAMLLARLQVEAHDGGAAIETLQRTLPYAQGNGDYQAFFAGVLARQGRHGDAVAQYQAALSLTPGNALWLMGLGIALQAQQQNGAALAAFQQAGASGTLSGDLQAFVERKIRQLQP